MNNLELEELIRNTINPMGQTLARLDERLEAIDAKLDRVIERQGLIETAAQTRVSETRIQFAQLHSRLEDIVPKLTAIRARAENNRPKASQRRQRRSKR